MILYENSISSFIEDANYNRISDKLIEKLRENHFSGGTQSEINSWIYSLQFMKNIVSNPQIPKDCRCAIEYNIPQTSKRIDFMICGQNENKENHLIIVELKLAIKSPHSLPFIPLNGLDVGIFDEAHRMQKKPYMYKGEDMLSDAIFASKVSVFFVDDNQRITVNDIYGTDSIYAAAKKYNAVIETERPFELSSQFRCNGSDGYLSFLNNLLGIQSDADPTLNGINYDFRVFDNPQELKDALKKADNGKNKSRMCAGYCYDWNVKHKRGDWDIIIDNFKAKWNLPDDDSFAVNPDSFDEVGCIHTVQGMEFDYVGVFIGKDLIYINGKVSTNKNAISKDDRTSGIRSCKDEKLASTLIRNTYRVLLSRGQRGCFVYCEDKALNNYLKTFVHSTI